MEQRGSRRPTYIQTTGRKNYAFPAPPETTKLPAAPVTSAVSEDPRFNLKKRSSTWKRKNLFIGVAGIVVIAIIGGGFFYITGSNNSPVPSKLSKAVDFPVYYPDPKKLPNGYSLNEKSFKSPQSGVIVYAVSYGKGQKLVFSVQHKPSSDDLASFVKTYIPINRQVLTLAGTATVGAIGQQTVASLPTDTNAWIIVTGPANAFGSNDFSQVLQALRK